MFESICQEALNVFKVEAASVQLFEPDADLGTVVASRGIDADAEACWVLTREDVRRQLDAGGAVAILDDAHGLSTRVPAAVLDSGFKKILCAVMLHEGEPLGVLTIYSRQAAPPFGAEDQALALTFADRAVVAIVNAQLYSDKLRQLEALTALYTGAQRLSGSLDLTQQAEDVARTCVEGFGARLAWLSRVEPDDGRGFSRASRGRITSSCGTSWARWPFCRGERAGGRLARKPRIIPPSAPLTARSLARRSARQGRAPAAFPLIAATRRTATRALQPGAGLLRADGWSSSCLRTLAAAAFENAASSRKRTAARTLNALRAIDSAITGQPDLRLSLDVCLDHVINQLKSTRPTCCCWVRSPDAGFVAGRGFYTTALRHTTCGWGGAAGQAALDRRWGTSRICGAAGIAAQHAPRQRRFVAYFAVPLTAKGR